MEAKMNKYMVALIVSAVPIGALLGIFLSYYQNASGGELGFWKYLYISYWPW